MRGRCVKILVLLSLIPLALRAAALLLGVGGHGAPPPPRPHHQSSAWARSVTAAAFSAGRVSDSGPLRMLSHRARNHGRKRPRTEGALAVFGTRRLRQVAGDGEAWFEDDKRLAPTGSNPLHNLR
ncbi:hypothetical protein ACP70R_031073 [Stipagrostis hirtigluma subsp. patula]